MIRTIDGSWMQLRQEPFLSKDYLNRSYYG